MCSTRFINEIMPLLVALGLVPVCGFALAKLLYVFGMLGGLLTHLVASGVANATRSIANSFGAGGPPTAMYVPEGEVRVAYTPGGRQASSYDDDSEDEAGPCWALGDKVGSFRCFVIGRDRMKRMRHSVFVEITVQPNSVQNFRFADFDDFALAFRTPMNSHVDVLSPHGGQIGWIWDDAMHQSGMLCVSNRIDQPVQLRLMLIFRVHSPASSARAEAGG